MGGAWKRELSFSRCLSALRHEIFFLNILNPSLFLSCIFKVTVVVYAVVFGELYIFAVNMDPVYEYVDKIQINLARESGEASV